MIHTILPTECLLTPEEPLRCECVSCPYGWVEGLRQPDGRLQVQRVISTDPAAYLDEAFMPGGYFAQ